MRRPPSLRLFRFTPRTLSYSTPASNSPIIAIENGTFYRNYPRPDATDLGSNPPLFPRLTFSLPSHSRRQEHWAIIGSSNAGKTTLLEILRGKHVSLPPTARSFPYLSLDIVDDRLRNTSRAIQYVGFDGEQGGIGKSRTRGTYMSARYESRREETDFSVLDYLNGNTDLNPIKEQEGYSVDTQSLDRVIEDLRLTDLQSLPMGNLSNGQTRRARIARALLGKPMVLLLDEPFMGLDPPTTTLLSPLLQGLAQAAAPRLIIALRPQDPLPDWITHVVQLGPSLQIAYQGERVNGSKAAAAQPMAAAIPDKPQMTHFVHAGLPVSIPAYSPTLKTEIWTPKPRRVQHRMAEKLVEMKDVHIKYGEKEVLGDWEVKATKEGEGKDRSPQRGLWWDVRRGDRWGVFGPNGSGKTTLISLICSDHPLSYSLPIKIFGRARLPQPGRPGISIFDIQARIGQSSPEIHAFFPRNISLRRVIENAWADTFLGIPRLTHENKGAVDACLRWFEAELNPAFEPCIAKPIRTPKAEYARFRKTDWAEKLRFGEAPFSAQRVALFLRAIVKKPEIIILDEAFSGMDEYVRDKCMLFLTWGETHTFAVRDDDEDQKRFVVPTQKEVCEEPMFEGLRDDQTLICISHVKEEVPALLENWMCLPEAGTGKSARFGYFSKTLEEDPKQWEEIWGV